MRAKASASKRKAPCWWPLNSPRRAIWFHVRCPTSGPHRPRAAPWDSAPRVRHLFGRGGAFRRLRGRGGVAACGASSPSAGACGASARVPWAAPGARHRALGRGSATGCARCAARPCRRWTRSGRAVPRACRGPPRVHREGERRHRRRWAEVELHHRAEEVRRSVAARDAASARAIISSLRSCTSPSERSALVPASLPSVPPRMAFDISALQREARRSCTSLLFGASTMSIFVVSGIAAATVELIALRNSNNTCWSSLARGVHPGLSFPVAYVPMRSPRPAHSRVGEQVANVEALERRPPHAQSAETFARRVSTADARRCTIHFPRGSRSSRMPRYCPKAVGVRQVSLVVAVPTHPGAGASRSCTRTAAGARRTGSAGSRCRPAPTPPRGRCAPGTPRPSGRKARPETGGRGPPLRSHTGRAVQNRATSAPRSPLPSGAAVPTRCQQRRAHASGARRGRCRRARGSRPRRSACCHRVAVSANREDRRHLLRGERASEDSREAIVYGRSAGAAHGAGRARRQPAALRGGGALQWGTFGAEGSWCAQARSLERRARRRRRTWRQRVVMRAVGEGVHLGGVGGVRALGAPRRCKTRPAPRRALRAPSCPRGASCADRVPAGSARSSGPAQHRPAGVLRDRDATVSPVPLGGRLTNARTS